jgi:hypothetical protein
MIPFYVIYYDGLALCILKFNLKELPFSCNSGICVIGDFSKSVPNQAAQNAVKQLISCSVARKKLSPSYTLRGHRDVKNTTSCPGTNFYNVIQTWKNYPKN